MPFAAVKLPDEPIVIISGEVPIEKHLPSLHAIFAYLDRLATNQHGPLYCIVDTRSLHDLSYSDILIWLDEQRIRIAGSIRDPRVRACAVGPQGLLNIAAKKLWQQFEVDFPIFPTMEEALAFIRTQIDSAPAESDD